MQNRLFVFSLFILWVFALPAQDIKWAPSGNSYYRMEAGEVMEYSLPGMQKTILLSADQITPAGTKKSLRLRNYFFSADGNKVLLYTNTKRVWRYDTRGDYWVYDRVSKKLSQIGVGRPESTLMFAKISPDGNMVAYVSEHNLYVEDLRTGKAKQLTSTDGTRKKINGTFDWVYEEEFDCRDGFRWSPDSKHIAYWQIDANQIRDFLMINNTDSIYPHTIPVEYPKVGEAPSPYHIGVVDIGSKKTKWMDIPGDPRQTYLPRMEWAGNANEVIVQQLNRKQNETKIMLCDAKTGKATTIYTEHDDAWIDVKEGEMTDYWDWVGGNSSFLWVSEQDGWRHVYRISRDGKTKTLLTKGEYDVISVEQTDEAGGYLYFMASPKSAIQQYLYRVKLDGKSTEPERITPAKYEGTHAYSISPNAKFAQHTFNSHTVRRANEWISLPDHKALNESESLDAKLSKAPLEPSKSEFFQVTTEEGITMDGWMVKPAGFDPAKKYPIVFYVYTEPAATTVRDAYGISNNRLYKGDMAQDGYIYASLDGRGTPSPKGRAWRKAIYRNIGVVNIRDQALGAKEMFKRWNWIDTSRVAVWGWSGGGSTTLNCLFQYPEIYKTGIAVAAVANQLTYDNIYQERYMGIPQENREDFVKGSPVTHAKNLRGNLLYIHGTGDDNVHYQNAEMLVNELVKYNRQFQFMAYPNRSHGIFEGDGTSEHLATLYTAYLRKNCPPGGK
jgi:dipeptidyl-peptidase-4